MAPGSSATVTVKQGKGMLTNLDPDLANYAVLAPGLCDFYWALVPLREDHDY